jgi:S1-C subfamily serine protease
MATLARQDPESWFSMGYPWGSQDGLTIGAYVGPERTCSDRRNNYTKWVVASLHLRPGHSGGPMFDSGGRLLGLRTVMQGPHVGVAVSICIIDHIVREFSWS